MKKIKSILITLATMFLINCGGGGSSEIDAPSSINGNIYKVTVTSGSGFYATSGTYTVSFATSTNTYTVEGDGVNTSSSSGSFVYTTDGNKGTVSIVDSVVSSGKFVLTFESETSGTLKATADSDSSSSQTGSFVQLNAPTSTNTTTGTNSSPTLSDLAGVWDATEVTGQSTDVIYTVFKTNGIINIYDYDGDSAGDGFYCYYKDVSSIEDKGNGNFIVTADFDDIFNTRISLSGNEMTVTDSFGTGVIVRSSLSESSFTPLCNNF